LVRCGTGTREALGEEEFTALRVEGHSLELEEAVELAFSALD